MNKKILIIVAGVMVLAIFASIIWYKLVRREVPQPGWITATERDNFLYGSVGAERDAGIPYWIWLVLPRMFPEYMRGNGGYISLGLSWEEGKEMPAGFSKKRVGYIRVAGNCALCHAASYRKGPDEGPEVVPFVPGRATDLAALLMFFKQCVEDPRFNAKELMTEINSWTKLSFADRLLYKHYLIPRTRRKLSNQDLVIIDSALQSHARQPYSERQLDGDPRMKAFASMVKEFKSPPYPLPVDRALVALGKPLFAQHCGSCHASDGKQMGTEIPIDEIGTDGAKLQTSKARGYVAGTLDGSWMRGPYLHNGSVPTIRDLLNPEALRPRTFYRGNNLLDARSLGFVSNLEKEKGLRFTFYDTSQPGNSNSGHLYGTGLSGSEKNALLEYLKTL